MKEWKVDYQAVYNKKPLIEPPLGVGYLVRVLVPLIWQVWPDSTHGPTNALHTLDVFVYICIYVYVCIYVCICIYNIQYNAKCLWEYCLFRNLAYLRSQSLSRINQHLRYTISYRYHGSGWTRMGYVRAHCFLGLERRITFLGYVILTKHAIPYTP